MVVEQNDNLNKRQMPNKEFIPKSKTQAQILYEISAMSRLVSRGRGRGGIMKLDR
jgi:hypothetical protein